jgi:hypothetical protein
VSLQVLEKRVNVHAEPTKYNIDLEKLGRPSTSMHERLMRARQPEGRPTRTSTCHPVAIQVAQQNDTADVLMKQFQKLNELAISAVRLPNW